MSPESRKLLSQFATALSNETIYGESDTASMRRWREYSAKTEAARKALEAHIESLEDSATVHAALTDAQIIAALHANGIDTYPSKYGFDAVQISATSVPSLRKVLETLAAPPLSSKPQAKSPESPDSSVSAAPEDDPVLRRLKQRLASTPIAYSSTRFDLAEQIDKRRAELRAVGEQQAEKGEKA